VRSWESSCITVPNFIKSGQSTAEILQFLNFSRRQLPSSWIFEILKFYWLTGSEGPRCTIMPNFVKIGQTIFEISCLFDFSRWQSLLSWISEILSAILDFRNSQVLLAERVQRAEMHQHAKFRQNLSIPCHPGFVWGMYGPPWRVLGGVYYCAKIGCYWCSSVENTKVWIFNMFGLKTHIHAQKSRFGGIWPLKWTAESTKPPKGTSLHESASFMSSSMKIHRPVWSEGDIPKKI